MSLVSYPGTSPMDIRTRINAIKAYCEKQGGEFVKWLGWYHFLNHLDLHSLQVAYRLIAQWPAKSTVNPLTVCPRYDRYESKPAYWVESELEAEWEKTTSRTRKETMDFAVDTTASDAMLQATAPLAFDMKGLANTGFYMGHGVILHVFGWTFVFSDISPKPTPQIEVRDDEILVQYFNLASSR